MVGVDGVQDKRRQNMDITSQRNLFLDQLYTLLGVQQDASVTKLDQIDAIIPRRHHSTDDLTAIITYLNERFAQDNSANSLPLTLTASELNERLGVINA